VDTTKITATFTTEDGKLLVLGQTSQIVILNRNSGELVKTLSFGEFSGKEVYAAWVNDDSNYQAHLVAVSPNGNLVVAGLGGSMRSWAKNLVLWNIKNKDHIAFLDGHHFSINAIAFTSDSRIIISLSSQDEMIKIWDTGNPISDLNSIHLKVPANALAVAPNSEFIVSGGAERKLTLWRLGNGNYFGEIPSFPAGWDMGRYAGEIITTLDFKADGTLIVGTMDDDVSFKYLGREPGHIYFAKIDPDNSGNKITILDQTIAS